MEGMQKSTKDQRDGIVNILASSRDCAEYSVKLERSAVTGR